MAQNSHRRLCGSIRRFPNLPTGHISRDVRSGQFRSLADLHRICRLLLLNPSSAHLCLRQDRQVTQPDHPSPLHDFLFFPLPSLLRVTRSSFGSRLLSSAALDGSLLDGTRLCGCFCLRHHKTWTGTSSRVVSLVQQSCLREVHSRRRSNRGECPRFREVNARPGHEFSHQQLGSICVDTGAGGLTPITCSSCCHAAAALHSEGSKLAQEALDLAASDIVIVVGGLGSPMVGMGQG